MSPLQKTLIMQKWQQEQTGQLSCRLPSAAGSVNDSCTANTHRGRHVNVVLPAVQECEYVVGGSCYTQSGISDVGHRRRCAGSRGRSLQDEGGEVENQREEMVEHILETEGGDSR